MFLKIHEYVDGCAVIKANFVAIHCNPLAKPFLLFLILKSSFSQSRREEKKNVRIYSFIRIHF